ncbi:MAG: galactose-1-phosphate uridylyltransferase [Candidatus Bathyarchaeota archaeon]|nr:MAG: galactose-1-phosphate uridylyltransferase [Candidatus Bathyarchaeota archaeon]
MLNDLRKDYLLDRWVVIATHRKQRPRDFLGKERASREISNKRSCPFCPGNERETPPAVLVYLKSRRGIVKGRDEDGVRHKDWLIRCVSNLYPAFSPPEKRESFKSGKAVGHHEVLIESPNHSEHPSVAKIEQLVHVINGYRDRLKDLSSRNYVRYVSIFRNHGADAGASLSHAHSQIIATPTIPRILQNELEASKSYLERDGSCAYCNILDSESGGPREVWENQRYFAFAPSAAVHPFELWIMPKNHETTLLDFDGSSVIKLAEAMRTCLGGLSSLLNDPPYNFGFHIAPVADAKHYHWHLEIYPRLSIWAGFEKSTGMYINVVPPEDSARNLKSTIEKLGD